MFRPVVESDFRSNFSLNCSKTCNLSILLFIIIVLISIMFKWKGWIRRSNVTKCPDGKRELLVVTSWCWGTFKYYVKLQGESHLNFYCLLYYGYNAFLYAMSLNFIISVVSMCRVLIKQEWLYNFIFSRLIPIKSVPTVLYRPN